MKEIVLFQKSKLNKILQWKIWVVEKGSSGFPEIFIEHGQKDGKKQITFDIIKSGVNIGKANETTAVEQAYLEMERKATKQREEGYKDSLEQAADDTAKTIDWTKPLPKELCFYKPKNSIDEKKIIELEKNNRAVYSVKRDGQMHLARMSDFGIEIYSRRMDLSTAKYPHLTEDLKNIPEKTILLGEIILDRGGKDNFKLVSGICRSDPQVATEKQKQYGKVKFYVFDIAFHKGVNLLTTMPFNKRREILLTIINGLKSSHIIASEVISKNHKAAMKEIEDRGLEGLVVWDSNGIMKDDECFCNSGKARRPNVIWKSKPIKEDDFIVRWDPDNGIGDFGSGKNKGKIKNVFIYQLLNGEEVFLGKCGGGLTDEQRDFYTDTTKFPRVWRIEFDSAQPKTGKLRFPVFNEDRTLSGDKDLDECEMSELIKAAREQCDDEDEEEEE